MNAVVGSGALAHRNGWGMDYAAPDRESMSLERLNGFLMDLPDQPAWRGRADEEADYYDSNQLKSEDLAAMRERGIPPVVVNLVAPTINMVLGFEAKTRRDWVVRSENEKGVLEAAAMSQKLKEAERMTHADRACSDAYAAQIKVGLGWVEVGSNKLDAMAYPHRCEYVHRREIWWDWQDLDPLLYKSRYLVRRKWYDEDIAMMFFHNHRDLIYNCVRNWANFDPIGFDTGSPLFQDFKNDRQFCFADEEWRNPLRRRVCLYEVWYRVMRQGFVLRLPDDRVIEFDRTNQVHVAAVQSGMVQPEPAMLRKMRLSWWLGPHRLLDIPTPYAHDEFPYVPFWGYREDLTGVPYGMIRAMRSMQDEVNARRARMLWQLSARRVVADSDAVINHTQVAQEIARPDAYVKLNPHRKNKGADAFRVDDNSGLNAQQYEVYQDSKKTLQDSAGVFMEQLGKLGDATSGVAISQLIEQGTTTLAEINDNFATGRTAVGQRLLSNIVHGMKGKQTAIQVEHKSKKRTVMFNRPKVDEVTGRTYLENDTTRLNMRVVLEDVPSSPTFRAQQFTQLTEMVKGLPENLQGAVIDIVIKASDVPQKEEVLERVKKALGIMDANPEEMTPEEMAEYEQIMADRKKMDELAKKVAELEAELTAAQVRKTDADTKLSEAKADQIKVESNLDPGLRRGAREDMVEDTPGARMIAAASAEEGDIPGADQALVSQQDRPSADRIKRNTSVRTQSQPQQFESRGMARQPGMEGVV